MVDRGRKMRRVAVVVVAAGLAAGVVRSGGADPSVIATTQVAAAPLANLFLSDHADGADATPLAGRTVPSAAYVFLAHSEDPADVSGIRQVDFALDGVHVVEEASAPFDLAGSPDTNQPYDTTVLAAGVHRVTARIRASDGTTAALTAAFTVASPIKPTAAPAGGGGGGGGGAAGGGGGGAAAPAAPAPAAPVVTTTTTAPSPSTTVPAAAPVSGSRVPRFAANSFWNVAIPNNAPRNLLSDALVADFNRQWHAFYNSININTTQYAPPIHVAAANDPLRLVRFWDCQNKGYVETGFQDQFRSVPIPSTLAASAGTDGELVIYQPSTDTVWEMWQARRASDGVWEACWGGRLTNVSQSQGVFAHPYGTTATGLSLAGGLITAEELSAGRIDHALAISMVETSRAGFSWPANRSDGWTDGATIIPEGLRFRLDPAIDVDALAISRTAKIVAKALQTYGMVVRDKSGAVTFYAENYVAEGRADPYGALFGAPSYAVLSGIPWTRLQALPMDYGKP